MAIEAYIVYPTNKYNRPAPSTIALHGLDGSPLQIHNHRFFHRPTSPFSDVIDKLKSSLAEALELYPPVAGTVEANENGDVYIAVDTKNASGTPFLVDTKETPYVGDSESLSPRTDVVLPLSSTVLAVKVTQFSCGTIAVAASINHQATDLCGFLDFLQLWAQLARGETIDFTTIPDVWARNPGRFFPGLIKEPTLTAPPLPPLPPFKIFPVPTEPPPSFTAPSAVSRWKFTKSAMERLKNDFSPSASSNEHESDLWISSGDALATLICGAITRARESGNVARLEGRSGVESQTEYIMMAADGRDRAPQGNMSNGQYFGNFNPLWSATISRSDLLSATCVSASRVALAFRKALSLDLTPQVIADKISFLEDPRNTKPHGRIGFSADIILTNWCRFDLQGPKLDFGWGKPFRSTDGGGSIFPPGYSIMTQEKDSGDVSVMMTVELGGAEALKADSLLNSYATLVLENPAS
ncbi:hypothetical protein BGX21_001727 [Mortierella sp. AD011]|nr:hypothetical protein BGX20_011707 [Mortierella sp. AD010]KAF9382806.1 hypothetical protein BGX21_001727 [Mortierella sp. AD011]